MTGHVFDQGKWCGLCGADSGIDAETLAECRVELIRCPECGALLVAPAGLVDLSHQRAHEATRCTWTNK